MPQPQDLARLWASPLTWADSTEQDEHFEVLAGTIRVWIEGTERTLGAGQAIDIPRGTVHQMWNAGDEPARVRWQTMPAGRAELWFRSIDALHRRGKVGSNGMPGLLAFASFLTEFRDTFRLVTPAAPAVRLLFAALAPIGRMRGYRPLASLPSRAGSK